MNCTVPSTLACLLLLVEPAVAATEAVIVTASKQHGATPQDLPLTLNVFGEAQLASRNATTLQDLSYAMPNVQIEDLGTARGIANVSIRGVGVNSSIPSVDPAVGVFVDGVYVGMNAGTLTNLLDVEAVEVLRGPQGTLYGHNVTGGAVLIRNRAPSDTFELNGRVTVASGPDTSGEIALSGPLVKGLLTGRLALTGEHDDGWLINRYDGSAFGKHDAYGARASFRLTPAPGFDMMLRLEHGADTGDGPAGQNHALFARSTFDFSLDNRGYAKTHWDQMTLETNAQTGRGTLTNITGWRTVTVAWAADIDSTPNFVFHTRILNQQSQVSDELRYAATFGPADAVVGVYFLEQNLTYIDERNFSPTFRRTGGGQGTFQDIAVFANADWHLSDTITLSSGLRFTHERKHSRLSRVRRAADDLDGPSVIVPGEGVDGGNIDARTLNFSDTPFFQNWNNFSPKLGLQWRPDEATNIYASWSRAFRGGGANFRTSSLGLKPLAYNLETLSAFELGWKQAFGAHTLNLALFHTQISNMQRETNLADPISGVQQLVLNAGDARLYGGEIEARFTLTGDLGISLRAGYVHGQYDRVTADLNGDLAVTTADAHMRIPRLAPLSAGIDMTYGFVVPGGRIEMRSGFDHRDASFYNDTNLGRLAETDLIDTNFTFTPQTGGWSVSLNGKNLTNVATWGGDTTLPESSTFGYSGGALPTFSPLNKGRVISVELRATY